MKRIRAAIAKADLGLRDWIETAGLALVVAAVSVAVGTWAALLVGGAALIYLSHAWVWEPKEEAKPAEVPQAQPVRRFGR